MAQHSARDQLAQPLDFERLVDRLAERIARKLENVLRRFGDDSCARSAVEEAFRGENAPIGGRRG